MCPREIESTNATGRQRTFVWLYKHLETKLSTLVGPRPSLAGFYIDSWCGTDAWKLSYTMSTHFPSKLGSICLEYRHLLSISLHASYHEEWGDWFTCLFSSGSMDRRTTPDGSIEADEKLVRESLSFVGIPYPLLPRRHPEIRDDKKRNDSTPGPLGHERAGGNKVKRQSDLRLLKR